MTILVDTDVLIWHLRGYARATRRLDQLSRLVISAVSCHGLQLGDALIAATAIEHRLQLLTGNVKHFAPIDRLTIETFCI